MLRQREDASDGTPSAFSPRDSRANYETPNAASVSCIKSTARYVLNRSVNRERFNDSAIYAFYLALRYPAYAKSKKAESDFYRRALENSPQLIFDIGANSGAKTAIFANLANKVISIEPSSVAVSILQRRFIYNHKVTIVAKGMGDCEGSAQLKVFDGADAYNTFSNKWAETLSGSGLTPWRPNKVVSCIVDTPMTTLDALIKAHGVPDYIKIDVEGYELQVVKGLSQPVWLISFEANLPEFKDETKEIIRLLSNLSPEAVYNFTTSEPPEAFGSPSWLGSNEMGRVIDSGQFGFLEIFFQSRPQRVNAG
jgi:FkbM family methyltransferase